MPLVWLACALLRPLAGHRPKSPFCSSGDASCAATAGLPHLDWDFLLGRYLRSELRKGPFSSGSRASSHLSQVSDMSVDKAAFTVTKVSLQQPCRSRASYGICDFVQCACSSTGTA